MRPRFSFLSFSLCLAVPIPAMLALGLGHVAAGCVFRSADDCELTLGFGCTNSSTTSAGGAGGGTGGASSTSTTTSTGGGGGTGGAPQCVDPALCPDPPPGACASLATKVCNAGKCAIQYTPGDAPSQEYGSCKKKVCDEKGALTDEVDDTNVYDDGNPCTTESCTNGVPGQTKTIGAPCTIGGGSGFCVQDAVYAAIVTCLECDPNGAPTCIGGAVCDKGKCVPAHCKNNVKDLGETAVDCGGASSQCNKCGNGKGCVAGATDCVSGICTGGNCVVPGCMDGVQNQDETDVDCGGQMCGQPCADNFKCALPVDCASKVCKSNVCQAPSCADGVQNGDEAGVDCGGADCPACAM